MWRPIFIWLKGLSEISILFVQNIIIIMTPNNHMNYLALNQNILNKSLVIGGGPSEGKSETPISTFEGLEVYLNGKHVMPELSELDQL